MPFPSTQPKSMEAQSLVSRFCSISPTQNHTTIVSPSSSSSSSSSHSLCALQSRKWVSLNSSNFAAFQSKRLVCKTHTQKLEPVTCEHEDSKIAMKRKKLAVFVSGGGSNFRSIHEASLQGSIYGDIAVVVTNKNGCGGAMYARHKGIPVMLFPKTKDEPKGMSPTDLVTALRKYEVDFVLLAGYLKLIPVELIRAYPRSILNIHPSLLPAFGGKGYYGIKVHKAVIASGARYSGPTIHFVDEHYDTGRILAQRVVPVLANDTAEDLARRVLQEEHQLYAEVAAALCEERIVWREDGVPLIRSKETPPQCS